MISSPNIFNAKIITYEDYGFKTLLKVELENTDKLIKIEISSRIFKEFRLGNSDFIKVIFPNRILLSKNECAIRLGVDNELLAKVIDDFENISINMCSKDFKPSKIPSKSRYIELNSYGLVFYVLLSEEEIKALNLCKNDEIVLQLNANELKIGILE